MQHIIHDFHLSLVINDMRTVGITGPRMALLQGNRGPLELEAAMPDNVVDHSSILIPDEYDHLDITLYLRHISVGGVYYDVGNIVELEDRMEFVFSEEGDGYFVNRMPDNTVIIRTALDPNSEDYVNYGDVPYETERDILFGDARIEYGDQQDLIDRGCTNSMVFLDNGELEVIGFSGMPWLANGSFSPNQTAVSVSVTINNGHNGHVTALDDRLDNLVVVAMSDGSVGIINTTDGFLSAIQPNGNIDVNTFDLGIGYILGVGLGYSVLYVLSEDGLVTYDVQPNELVRMTDPVPYVLDTTDVIRSHRKMIRVAGAIE